MTVKLDDKLIESAMRLGKYDTATEAVNAVLHGYVERQAKLQAVIDLMGTIDFDPDYDYKAARKRDGVGFD